MEGSPADEIELGTVLPGRFRIDARIAEGSFGIVYRAHQLAIGRDVAVKVLRAGIDPFSEEGRLFVEEIQAVGRIVHGNVVRVYQADITADGRLFFAMELLDGDDLQARAAAGPMPLADALPLMSQLLAGLDAAHRAGLVHADVKPGNVIVTADGRAVLVDFGLARLRHADEAAASVGGTPAYMAPEQLADGIVDARSDLFAAALVLVTLTTGWRRTRARDLTPPAAVLAQLDDERVRAALVRALEVDPAARFASATAFSAALTGEDAPPDRPPFHGLAAFDERDRGLLFGRDRELMQLSELALHRPVIVVTAPSGVGKTSLLRAGLRPRLESLGVALTYVSCRNLSPDRPSPSTAILLDQVETALEAGEPTAAALLDAVLDSAHRDPAGAATRNLAAASDSAARAAAPSFVAAAPAAIISVREDFLARLLDRAGSRLEGAPIVRIGPLAPAGARDAIVGPLAERGLTIAPDLLDRLLADLIAAGRHLGAELGWGALEPIYPPHLQLACSVLYERLPAGESTLTLRQYLDLGGFDAIVGEHLDHVLDGLDTADGATARDLFLALVTAAHGRSARTESELADTLGTSAPRLSTVLEHLRRQGLVVRVRRPDGEIIWELIHDSLVPRVLAWIDRRDLSRRRAIELVRYHLRRSQRGEPSLLSRAELRELAPHRDAITALDAEWRRTARPTETDAAWTPAALVTRSRQVQRRVTLATIALIATVIAGIAAAILERRRASSERKAELARRDRDLGLISFELAPFDWNPSTLTPTDVPVVSLPNLTWRLHTVAIDPTSDLEIPGEPFASSRFRLLSSHPQPAGTRLDAAEASGGAAFLVISGRNRPGEHDCGPSIIPIRALPGYPQRSRGPERHRIAVPTCQSTLADMIRIPAGPFIHGGVGEPPSPIRAQYPPYATEQQISLPEFFLARTETTNAQYQVFVQTRALTGIDAPPYLDTPELAHAGDPASPASGIPWRHAHAFCSYMGRRLPSTVEWSRAIRGPALVDGYPNRRTFAWPGDWRPGAARVDESGTRGVAHVATHPVDTSIEGIVDLTGNVMEWTRDFPIDGNRQYRIARGAAWDSRIHDLEGTITDRVGLDNPRRPSRDTFEIGVRCAR